MHTFSHIYREQKLRYFSCCSVINIDKFYPPLSLAFSHSFTLQVTVSSTQLFSFSLYHFYPSISFYLFIALLSYTFCWQHMKVKMYIFSIVMCIRLMYEKFLLHYFNNVTENRRGVKCVRAWAKAKHLNICFSFSFVIVIIYIIMYVCI